MNFTREPIVETIISAKEGFKLSIKSSKHIVQEEYLVDAVEVVSFSGALFYRSQEKPKSFFIPIHDYEIQEVREAKLTIRSPVMEKSIKIGGGKEASRQSKPEPEEKIIAVSEEFPSPVVESEGEVPQVAERHKREKRQKYRRKRGFEEGAKDAVQREVKMGEDGTPLPVVQVPTESVFSHLLKPPESLISDSIHKYKKIDEEALKSPEVVHDLQAPSPATAHPSFAKQEDPEFFSEAPQEYERFVEDVIEVETLILSRADLDKPQE